MIRAARRVCLYPGVCAPYPVTTTRPRSHPRKCLSPYWVGSSQGETRRRSLASGGAAVVRGSCASPDSAVLGSNRRAQAIHGLLAPDPRTIASFASWMSVASSMPAPACPAEAGSATPRRTSLQGDFVRAVHGCTAPACWSRTRNHAADEIPLQRRPLPEARLLPLQRRPPPEAKLLPLQRRPPPEGDASALALQRRPPPRDSPCRQPPRATPRKQGRAAIISP